MGKHIPIRECICCRKKGEKYGYIRVVNKEDTFFVDPTQKSEGRGAYLCRECLMGADLYQKRFLDRAFRKKVPVTLYQMLEAMGKEIDSIG